MGRSPSKRGLGYSFGPDYTEAFLAKNNLSLVIRSHEVRDEGYELEHNGKCITVFSAPNYCDQMGNKGAFLRFSDPVTMKPSFTKFEAVSHPDVPPMRYAGNMFSL
jgi:serine/threonine-protein phosphatase 5